MLDKDHEDFLIHIKILKRAEEIVDERRIQELEALMLGSTTKTLQQLF